jgi:NAD-reducing hydrogenase small subunit
MDAPKQKIRIATTSLAGCFGCHMSILDIDEKIIDLVELVEFDRSPLTDIKQVGECDIGIIEGAVANSENVEVLREFRKHCKIIIAMGACALNGGIPAIRNHYTLEECLNESYMNGMGLDNQLIPNDPELPMILNKVHPVQDVVKVDYMLPGCPPTADMIWDALTALIEGREPSFTMDEIRYD